MQIRTKIISSLEKVFLDSRMEDFKPLSFIRMMKNQRLSVQLVHTIEGDDAPLRIMPQIKLSGALADCARMRTVEVVPVAMPVSVYDDNYLRVSRLAPAPPLRRRYLCHEGSAPCRLGGIYARGQPACGDV